MQDYYHILGVKPKDDIGSIRAAYRRLVRELHPDTGLEPPDHQRFAQVTEAYRVLSDEKERKKYNAVRLLKLSLPISPLLAVMEDPVKRSQLTAKIAGVLHKLSQHTKRKFAIDGRDMAISKDVTFADSYHGATLETSYLRPVTCARCEGTGFQTYEKCEACNGLGRSSPAGFAGFSKRCPRCGGLGLAGQGKCRDCGGDGSVNTETTVAVKVPAGILNGVRLRVPGKGEEGRFGGKDGALLIHLSVEGSLYFDRRGDDLLTECEVPLRTAVEGGQATVALPAGKKVNVFLDSGSFTGQKIRVSGYGFRDPKTNRTGDLVLTVNVHLPADLSAADRETAMQWLHGSRTSSAPIPDEIQRAVRKIIEEQP